MSEIPQKNVRAWISSAVFNDDAKLDFTGDEIVLFVGPNNSGKSAALRDFKSLFQNGNGSGVVVRNVEISRKGTSDELFTFLSENAFSKETKAKENVHFTFFDSGINWNSAKASWNSKQSDLNTIAKVFCCYLDTEARLTAANPPQSIAMLEQALQHPIHYLYRDDQLELKISKLFHRAFGQDLIVNRGGGNQVPLHCGKRPIPENGEDRVSSGYLTKLQKLPTLHSQGDGMRGFVGVLLHTLVVNHSTVLLDEPEAFLHPPQAKLLGRLLAKEGAEGRQLFISTHSGDFLRGALDSNVKNLRIVRIERSGNINHIRELKSEQLKEFWDDPLLRYSNVLDGIFHEKVIVCESDADCRFYGAILDSIFDSLPDTPKPDIMFVHCGGKDRIASVVRALKALGVKTAAIADFDILREENPLRKIFEELGYEWTSIEKDWKLVKTAIEKKKAELSSDDVKRDVRAILDEVKETQFPKEGVEQIQKALKRASPWAHAKETGKAFVPSGQETEACDRLLEVLRGAGLFVVEVGELESFDRKVGRHGPAWVNQVITKNLATDPDLEFARKFVKSVCSVS